MAVADIVSEEEVLSELGFSDPTEDQLTSIRRLKLAAEKAARRFTGATLTQGTYTHYLPRTEGAAMNVLRLPEWPVRSITSIYLDHNGYFGQAPNAFAATTILTAGQDYYLNIDRGGMSFFGYVTRIGAMMQGRTTLWPRTPGSVKITYVAGFSSSELSGEATVDELNPQDIRAAVLLTIGARWHALENRQNALVPGDVQSESLEGWSETKVVQPTDKEIPDYLPDDAKALLKPYKRPVWM